METFLKMCMIHKYIDRKLEEIKWATDDTETEWQPLNELFLNIANHHERAFSYCLVNGHMSK